MRALVLSSLYPPHALGGYEMSCQDVMTRFEARGHEVVVLTTDTRLPDVVDVEQPNVRRALKWYWADHQIVQPRVRELLEIERHNRMTLARTLEEMKPDVVSVWSMGAMSLGLIDLLNRYAKPKVYVVCDEWPVYGPRLDGWIATFSGRRRRALGKMIGVRTGLPTTMAEPRNATMCWLSNYVRDRVAAATGWTPEHQTVTYSGIDPADFPLVTAAERSWAGRLVAVGRVEPRKGFTDAVQALPALPDDVTLQIVGPDDGQHRQELADLARQLGVRARVSFSTSPRNELRKVYEGADALLFTSAWDEPFGLVPVEAMACGVPVVAAATGGAREYLVDETNCLVVPPRDPAALADAVRRLAGHPALRAHLVTGGLATAAEFSVDRLADVLEQWHLAAATGYASGEPPHRASARST